MSISNARPSLGKHLSGETKKKISSSLKGRVRSEETRRKQAVSKYGEFNPSWKGGVTPENKKIRKSLDYRLWRDAVFKRDDYTCQMCGKRGGKLHSHHKKSFSEHPELRLDVGNGETLCADPCHKLTDNYGSH